MVTHSLLAVSFLLFPTSALACFGSENMLALSSDDASAPDAFVSFDPPPISAPFGIELVICNADIVDVEIDALMPLHQHGMNYEPVVSKVGEGVFEVSGMVFHMPGLWRVEVVAQNAGAKMRYWLDVQLK